MKMMKMKMRLSKKLRILSIKLRRGKALTSLIMLIETSLTSKTIFLVVKVIAKEVKLQNFSKVLRINNLTLKSTIKVGYLVK